MLQAVNHFLQAFFDVEVEERDQKLLHAVHEIQES
ncbi:DUF3967 domain-containing protein [Bacillus songklensis]|uniref:DUF3967 domain-containing protein n=1 Tax=Bacillus songklensis TaxID=1069116 RepID=A0ABV8B7E8_9BACI